MSATEADFWDKFHADKPGEANLAPIHPRAEPRVYASPRRRRRPLRAFLRFLLTVGLGVGGTLAWQSYGDMAREMAADAYPQQLGWVKPSDTPTTAVAATATAAVPASTAAATVGAAAPVPTHDQQQLAAISLSLADVRRSVEELAAQVTSSQQQTASDIARLQASELDLLAKVSAPPPRPAPVRRPAPAPLALSPAAPAATH